MFGNIGGWEIILIVLAILILFGAKKIPELAQGVGKGMKEFKKAIREVEEDIKFDDNDKPSSSTKKETEKRPS